MEKNNRESDDDKEKIMRESADEMDVIIPENDLHKNHTYPKISFCFLSISPFQVLGWGLNLLQQSANFQPSEIVVPREQIDQ